ncbi:MAG: hypothetical protein ABSE89_07305 [Sedimentisphaerales bacterium]
MAIIVYVDGTLQTGNNDGSGWENAYRGCGGLQTALNNVANGSDTIIYVRNTFSVGTYGSTISIYLGGDYTSNKWLKIIGCDSVTGSPLPQGQYVTLDAEDTLANHIVSISNANMVHIENVHFTRVNAIGKAGCYLTASSSKYGFNFVNCKFTYSDYGIYASSYNLRNLYIGKCIFLNNILEDILSYSTSTIVINNFFNSSCQAISAVYGVVINGCILKCTQSSGAVVTANSSSSQRGEAIIANCTFYCTGTGGITAISCNSFVGPVITNNIIYLARPESDYPISASRISYEDYNCTNASFNILTGSHSLNATDPQFVDAANGNFRPRNSLVLRCGMPDLAGNPAQIGAIQDKYQFISKAKAANFGRLSIFR